MNKTHILQEIRRTAAANGGIPLGFRRFATETGIREADWMGKFWARWGDALSEAGFRPNQIKRRYDRTWLLEKYASFAHELGRLPTVNDLRLKHQHETEFPDAKVFRYRFGPKIELVEQILEFCRGCQGYEDVISLCEAHIRE
jgi:hypothetical protein